MIASIDRDVTSNASIKDDIRSVKPSSLSAVADVIWASPDSTTYMGEDCHRRISREQYSISEEAVEQDYAFCHLYHFMQFTKAKHPHCVFIIENPTKGCFGQMPRKCSVVSE